MFFNCHLKRGLQNERKCENLTEENRKLHEKPMEENMKTQGAASMEKCFTEVDVKKQNQIGNCLPTFSAPMSNQIDLMIKVKILLEFSTEIIDNYSESIFAKSDGNENLFENYKQQNTTLQNVKDTVLLSLLQDTRHKMSLSDELYRRAKLLFTMSEKEIDFLFPFLQKSLMMSDLATLLSNHDLLTEKHRKVIELYILEEDTRLQDLLALEQILNTHSIPMINPATINKFIEAIVQDIKARVLLPIVKNVALKHCLAVLRTMAMPSGRVAFIVILEEMKAVSVSAFEKTLRKKVSTHPETEWAKVFSALCQFVKSPSKLGYEVKSITPYALERKIKSEIYPDENLSAFEKHMNSLMLATAKHPVYTTKLKTMERYAFELSVRSKAVSIIKEFVMKSNLMYKDFHNSMEMIKNSIKFGHKRMVERKIFTNFNYFSYMKARKKS